MAKVLIASTDKTLPRKRLRRRIGTLSKEMREFKKTLSVEDKIRLDIRIL